MPISTNINTEHPLVNGMQDCSNEEKTQKSTKLKIFFSRTAGPISFKPDTKHPLVKWILVCLNKEHSILKRRLFILSLNSRYGCRYMAEILLTLRKTWVLKIFIPWFR